MVGAGRPPQKQWQTQYVCCGRLAQKTAEGIGLPHAGRWYWLVRRGRDDAEGRYHGRRRRSRVVPPLPDLWGMVLFLQRIIWELKRPSPHRDKSRSYKTTPRKRGFLALKGRCLLALSVHGGATRPSSHRDKSRSYKTTPRKRGFLALKGRCSLAPSVHGGVQSATPCATSRITAYTFTQLLQT